ncbi:LytTR family transcriptional regulator [Rhodocytophaga rosea]|uniref:LytTR family transcriptional regulator n=1 Tax=Rhodocytophaga rosea TaxID=2704465 RepID=A0A6C0GPL0_9BACT|nr:LytTR family DNA-binding domain-containing protein [Rhodocytophaga rosea]QHT69522.1 LytTR family transcriptional regulator [Rhodocytophaga rosea]
MLSFLRQPYPIDEPKLTRVILQSLLVGIFVAFVLIVFQPFGSYNWQHAYKILILMGYGAVASFTTFLNFFALPKLTPLFYLEKYWTVWKEITWNLMPCVIGGFLSVVYGYLIGAMPFTFTQISYMIVVVFLVGLFPAIILVLLNYVYLIRKYRAVNQYPEKITTTEDKPAITETTIELMAENEKDRLKLPASQLVYIEASDNYCTVFHLTNQKLTKTLIRSSLSRLESQLSIPEIARCHRSYIVNFRRVKHISGNAQGYKLHLDATNFVVPVARTYSYLLKEQLVAS